MKLVNLNISFANKALRFAWNFVWYCFYRPSPIAFFGWRRMLLRVFGSNIHPEARPYPTARIWAPWNLSMDKLSCLSHEVNCYCVAKVSLGCHSLVSQGSHLCTATHDYSDLEMPLLAAPIHIGNYAWVTADVFIAPGVNIGDGAVINARSSVFEDIEPWSVARGYPAKSYKKRILKGVHE